MTTQTQIICAPTAVSFTQTTIFLSTALLPFLIENEGHYHPALRCFPNFIDLSLLRQTMLEIFRTYKFRILSVRIIRFFSTLYVTIFILDSSSQRQDNGFLMYVGKAFFFLSFFLTFFRSFFLSFLLSLFLSFFRSFYYKIFQILFSIKRFKIICDYTRVSLHNRLCLLTQLWLKVSFVGLF